MDKFTFHIAHNPVAKVTAKPNNFIPSLLVNFFKINHLKIIEILIFLILSINSKK